MASDLQALRGKINALKVQREGLSDRVRNLRLLHSPPLPKKVLLEIFSYLPLTGADVSRKTLRSSSHLQDIQLSLFHASAVCRAWRDALQSDHSIWSYISFVRPTSHRVSEFQVKMQDAIFQQQLQKAQSSTLSVVIASPIHQAPISFWKTCRRWSYLDAVMMTTDMLNAFQHRHRNRVEGTPGPLFPALTHLRLPFSSGGLEKAQAIAMFGESPHLQSLTLNGLRFQDIPRKLLRWLRVLRLDPMNAQEVHLTGDRRSAIPYHTEGVLDFLSHTALLEELYAYNLTVSDRPSKSSPVKLKNLTRLCLTGSYGHLLPYLSSYDSLKHLDIQLLRSHPQEMYDVLMSFLERCTPALTNIRIISDFAFTTRQIIPIVEVTPSLTSLILESSGPPAADIFDCIHEEGLLLNLRSLCIISHSEPTSLETLDAILRLCQSSWGPQNLVKPAVPTALSARIMHQSW